MEGRTSLVVAHRLSTVRDVDRIVVMHKGRIREEGTHQELLKQRGLYYKLYLLQYKDQEAAAAGRPPSPPAAAGPDRRSPPEPRRGRLLGPPAVSLLAWLPVALVA